MLVYDVYVKRLGIRYYDKFHLQGSEKQFDCIEADLARYARWGLIDAYFMFELSPEDAEDEEDD